MTAHLKPRSATIVIYQGDDMDRLAELNRAVQRAKRTAEQPSSNARDGDEDHSVTEAENAYDTFVDEAAARALEVVLEAIGRRRFRDLLLDHAPRKVERTGEDGKPETVDHEDDAGWGVNVETFPMALLTFREGSGEDLVATVARPKFSTSADLQRFLDDELADGDFEQLWVAAHMLNRSPSGDPLALRYRPASPSSDET